MAQHAGTGLTVTSPVLAATFLPDLGMLGASLRHGGDELLALPGGLDGYRAGQVTGLPLLAPWANRLGARRYQVGGVEVDLEGVDLVTDEHGLPIHGTMTARAGWQVVARRPGAVEARFDLGAHPDLMATFPFPHELRIAVAVEAATLWVATTLVPTGDRAVPVSFGYHPYLLLPGASRPDVRLRMPARRRVVLDDRGIPTGAGEAAPAEDEPIGDRHLDDHYALDGGDGRFTLAAGGRALTLRMGDGYHYAQVFTPPGDDCVCLEPMTAPVNALVDGGYALVQPGDSYSASFSLEVT
jgi:galactose mutarotase-like enzyme